MQTPWRKGIRVSLFIFIFSFAYAVYRYNILQNVPFSDILIIINKGLALSSVFIIGFSYALGPLARFWPNTFVKRLPLRKSFGLLGFGAAAAHSILSLLLFPERTSAALFEEGILTALTSSPIFGILAFIIFSGVALTSVPFFARRMTPLAWRRIQRLGYVAYFFTLLHVAVMGGGKWFLAKSYFAYTAPITLIAALFIILVLLLRVIAGSTPSRQNPQKNSAP